jgi:hypothetical protein
MRSKFRLAACLLGVILLVGLAILCGYGFLASYEFGFPNLFHTIYGGILVAAVIGAVWLVFPAIPKGRVVIYVGRSIIVVMLLAAVCNVVCGLYGIPAVNAALCGALMALGGFLGTAIAVARQRTTKARTQP